MKTSFWFVQTSRRVNGMSQNNGGDDDDGGCGGDDNRVPKCDVIKNEICEIMGFVKLF